MADKPVTTLAELAAAAARGGVGAARSRAHAAAVVTKSKSTESWCAAIARKSTAGGRWLASGDPAVFRGHPAMPVVFGDGVHANKNPGRGKRRFIHAGKRVLNLQSKVFNRSRTTAHSGQSRRMAKV